VRPTGLAARYQQNGQIPYSRTQIIVSFLRSVSLRTRGFHPLAVPVAPISYSFVLETILWTASRTKFHKNFIMLSDWLQENVISLFYFTKQKEGECYEKKQGGTAKGIGEIKKEAAADGTPYAAS